MGVASKPWRELKKKLLRDPEIAREYDKLTPRDGEQLIDFLQRTELGKRRRVYTDVYAPITVELTPEAMRCFQSCGNCMVGVLMGVSDDFKTVMVKRRGYATAQTWTTKMWQPRRQT